MEAIRKSPCRRIETNIAASPLSAWVRAADAEAELSLRLLDAALKIADRVHLAQVDTDRYERAGDLGRQTGDDHARSHEAGGVHSLDQVVGDRRVDLRHSRDVDDYHLRPVRSDASQQLIGQLSRALGVEHSDDRQDE